MIDRLRMFWQQPLEDAARGRLFLIAAALVVGVAALALLVQRSPLAPGESRRTPGGGQPPPAGAPPLSTAIVAPAAPSEESRPSTDAAGPAGIRAARRAARWFLRGYLPYSYGRGDAGSITNVSQRFRKQLAKEPPRVPRRERHRRARVSLVQTNVVDERHASLSALVTDGARSYTLELRLGRRGPGWQVDGVTG